MNKIKTISSIIFLASSLAFAGNPKDEGYNIKFKVKGLKEGAQCLLANYYGDKQYIKDSAKVGGNGEVIFSGKEKNPEGIYLFVLPGKNKYFDFVMDAEQNFTLETDTLDFTKNMKAKGSQENKDFYDYQNFMAGKQKEVEPLRNKLNALKKGNDSIKIITDKLTAIDNEVKKYKLDYIKNNPKSFVAKIYSAMEEPEVPEAPILSNGRKDSTFAYRYYKSHFWDTYDFGDERLLRTPIFNNKFKQYMDKLTPHTADSINIACDYMIKRSRANKEVFKYVAYWLTLTYEESKIMGDDAVFVHMVDKYLPEMYWVDSTHNYKMRDRINTLKPVLIGQKAPLIVMPDSLGKNISLYDIKSKYTVVLFWDHGCSHCKKEVPKLVEAYNKTLKAKGVTVYAIETEDKPEEWRKFIRANKMEWINVHQKDEYLRAVTKKIYDIYSTPVIYLLDENKIIRAKRVDADQLDGLIDMFEKIEKEKQKEKQKDKK
jgi:peroxiredoxin